MTARTRFCTPVRTGGHQRSSLLPAGLQLSQWPMRVVLVSVPTYSIMPSCGRASLASTSPATTSVPGTAPGQPPSASWASPRSFANTSSTEYRASPGRAATGVNDAVYVAWLGSTVTTCAWAPLSLQFLHTCGTAPTLCGEGVPIECALPVCQLYVCGAAAATPSTRTTRPAGLVVTVTATIDG